MDTPTPDVIVTLRTLTNPAKSRQSPTPCSARKVATSSNSSTAFTPYGRPCLRPTRPTAKKVPPSHCFTIYRRLRLVDHRERQRPRQRGPDSGLRNRRPRHGAGTRLHQHPQLVEVGAELDFFYAPQTVAEIILGPHRPALSPHLQIVACKPRHPQSKTALAQSG